MGALETAKELGRMATTATLTKDVIDLFKEKVALLADQVTTLEAENANLKEEVANLQEQLSRVQPKGELAEDTVRVLKVLFDNDGLTDSQIASALGISKGMAEYHTGALHQKKMLTYPMIRTIGREPGNFLCQSGREYLVKHGHVR
jgi:antitoxin component HigA of HigAB toxin-antitoxin module